MAKKNNKAIPRADFPEQVGISSSEFAALIRDFESSNIEVHSMMVIRHGKIAFECYRHPYNAKTPHTMYSVSKSYTSVAMGFAIDEGLISLDTKVIDIFPEYRPKKPDENLEKMTVYHLLTMSAGKEVSVMTNKSKSNWVKDFFNAKWGYAPGEGWKYISENTYMCCAIIKRVTGMGVIDYLTPRLFEPLGYERRPFWETDTQGLEAGGWGLFVTTDELARFILCLQQKGMYAGKQVIPAWYVEEATRKHADNPQYDDRDACVGYGYFFWLNDLKNSYRSDGMFSQFGIDFKDYDAVLAFTCSEVFEQKARDCIFRHFPHVFIDECENGSADAAKELSLSPLPVLDAAPRSVIEEFVAGKIIHLNKNRLLNAVGWPVSMLPMAVVYTSSAPASRSCSMAKPNSSPVISSRLQASSVMLSRLSSV